MSKLKAWRRYRSKLFVSGALLNREPWGIFMCKPVPWWWRICECNYGFLKSQTDLWPCLTACKCWPLGMSAGPKVNMHRCLSSGCCTHWVKLTRLCVSPMEACWIVLFDFVACLTWLLEASDSYHWLKFIWVTQQSDSVGRWLGELTPCTSSAASDVQKAKSSTVQNKIQMGVKQ